MAEMPTISVTELVEALKEVVEATLPPVCVEAEVSNCRPSASGHVYLTLKDERSEIRAVMWRSAAEALKFKLRDGLKVLAVGALEVYVPRGSCQFMIQRLQPSGVGELELAFRQLKDKLQAEGLFDAARKRPLPRFPRRIALVTSHRSAAVQDMLQVLTRRWPAAKVVIFPVPVQGEGAAPRIARAVRSVNAISDIDVVICGRGGGSLEDLWAFNEEVLVRAIAESEIPVISAVGHETDVTIADMVADCRAQTPSEAAELAVPSADELNVQLHNQRARMRQLVTNRLQQLQAEVKSLSERRVLQRPTAVIDERRQFVDECQTRAEHAIRRRIETLQIQLEGVGGQLEALSPLKVFSRGYSVARMESGRAVRSITDLKIGDVLSTQLLDGVVRSRVEECTDGQIG